MFYMDGSYCYCIPDEFDGDFCYIAGKEYQIDFDYQGDAYVTVGGQAYFVKSY